MNEMTLDTEGCGCAGNWRVYAFRLRDGSTITSLDFVSLEFETVYLQPGQGTLVLRRRTVQETAAGLYFLTDLLPGRTGLIIQRIAGGSATAEAPRTMMGAIVQSLSANPDGTVTLGFVEYNDYLNHRHLTPSVFGSTADWVYTDEEQTYIAADLVNYLIGFNTVGSDQDNAAEAPSMQAIYEPNVGVTRDRTYFANEYKNLGEAIQQLTQVENGPIYEMQYIQEDGTWIVLFYFRDVLEPEGKALISHLDLVTYTLSLDLNEMANVVYGLGEQVDEETEEALLAYTASVGASTQEVPYEAVPSWSTVTDLSTLNENAAGYLETHDDRTGGLAAVFSGLGFPQIDYLQPGYPVQVQIDSEFVKFFTRNDNTVITGVSWSVSGDTESITVNISALDVTESLFQTGDTSYAGCEGC